MGKAVDKNHLLTLNYRIALENGQEVISTYQTTLAIMPLGNGELLTSLENLLAGLALGRKYHFELNPEQAFGVYQETLQERVLREDMPLKNIKADALIGFMTPDGIRYSALDTNVDDATALLDLNHPLARKKILFDVHVLDVI